MPRTPARGDRLLRRPTQFGPGEGHWSDEICNQEWEFGIPSAFLIPHPSFLFLGLGSPTFPPQLVANLVAQRQRGQDFVVAAFREDPIASEQLQRAASFCGFRRAIVATGSSHDRDVGAYRWQTGQ